MHPNSQRVQFLNQLHQHVATNILYPPLQSAYWKSHSTETALLKTQNDILLNMNSQKVTLPVLLDLSVAFDIIDHSILISRLQNYLNISGTALEWFKNYRSDCSQRIFVDGGLSKKFDVTCDVPQGSCVGPLLFIVYAKDLFNVIDE